MNIAEFTPPIELHNNLNPNIWDGEDLRKDVQVALLRIAKEYYKFLDIQAPVVDIVISGSQANYNYTKHSDLDLHLIMPYSQVKCDTEVKELFDTKRRLWKENHNITIRGVPVELYVEDVNEPAVSATYSIIKNKWISKPSMPSADSYDEPEVRRLVELWERIISSAIATGQLELCVKVKDMLKAFRQAGLDKGGEYNPANLAFKSLRNDGYVGKLMGTIADLTDKKLSI